MAAHRTHYLDRSSATLQPTSLSTSITALLLSVLENTGCQTIVNTVRSSVLHQAISASIDETLFW